jgi:hypothetical protein
MKLSRPTRSVTALIALISMLFTQLAVAGYACPDMKIMHAGESAVMMTDDGNQHMSGCIGMDMEQPNLCQAHDQVGTQSLDKPGAPHVSPFMAAALTVVFHDIETASKSIAAQAASVPLTRTTAPPLSIRNCCFRI